MITSGTIENTHYNLIDTLKQFMGPEWDRCYKVITDYIKKHVLLDSYLECVGPCPHPFIDKTLIINTAAADDIVVQIYYAPPIRYTIVEAVIWQYINFEIKE